MGRWRNIQDEVKAAVGDVTDPEARRWALESARRINAEAHFLTAEVSLGTTVAGQSTYPLAQSMVDLTMVRVGDGEYTRVSPREMWELQSGRGRLRGSGGVFAPAYSATGVVSVEFYPTPARSGIPIQSFQVIDIPEPVLWETSHPPFPSDFDRYVVHGAAAVGLAIRDDRFDAAQWHEERANQAVGLMKRRRYSRIGSGPARIRVKGKDF